MRLPAYFSSLCLPRQMLLAMLAACLASGLISCPVISISGLPDLGLRASGQDPFIPRRQSSPPGPPLSPAEAVAKMTVPPGFRAELVCHEPDLLNPVAMAFDDRGRIYVTESFEYPRHEPGPGRDRIKILTDTTGDGYFDDVKIFAEGLNIPSGIAVGHGGVWVANAPDILFLEDTDGDDRADRSTVVATGFGRDDTHELPNALTWGPDGYLYGLNGVFNRSVVKQDDRVYDFTCAMFRIDPVTRRFDLFCEGTSNPWGIAFDDQGSAFVSACVIDHLWHLTETGYYHRQGGPYPPHTWKIESIVDYKHQMAAYCGIEYFDSPAYPEPYRNKLYMGNIHGGCINVDSVTRQGSTYRGQPHDDFITANDVWFMPVAQKTGPDGCLYVLDWYDRYHCYQDASADPQGVDRGHGRLYRIVHQTRPAIKYPDLNLLSNEKLGELLGDANIFYRQRAAIILSHRLRSQSPTANPDPAINNNDTTVLANLERLFSEQLTTTAAIDQQPRFPLFELTTLLYAPQTSSAVVAKLLGHEHPQVVAWAVRAAASRNDLDTKVLEQIQPLAAHADPRVRLQVAIAANKAARQVPSLNASQWLLDVLAHSEDDGLLPRIVWRNLEPRVTSDQAVIVDALDAVQDDQQLLVAMAPRIADRLLADIRPELNGKGDAQRLRGVMQLATKLASVSRQPAIEVLERMLSKLRSGELRPAVAGPVLAANKELFSDQQLALADHPAVIQLMMFAAEPRASELATEMVLDRALANKDRLGLLRTLASVRPAALGPAVRQWSDDLQRGTPVDNGWRDGLLETVIRNGDAETIQQLITTLPSLPTGVQATVASQMCQRQATAKQLLTAITAAEISKEVVGPNQVRSLAANNWPDVSGQVGEIWGMVRQQDSAERKRVVEEMTQYLLKDARGNAKRGVAVWNRVCGQCHKLHGQGFDVGPDLTSNGRGNFEQLIISVFDPSLVIGNAYQNVTVVTTDGRVLNGIVIERSGARVVLKTQGGKTEVIASDDIDQLEESKLSLMPEGLEQQISKQEIADLFALLALRKEPGKEATEEENEVIAGTPAGLLEK
ncbi:PVC-type heme-binding CxxCH protein [Planctomycetaceae bacterium SH139]